MREEEDVVYNERPWGECNSAATLQRCKRREGGHLGRSTSKVQGARSPSNDGCSKLATAKNRRQGEDTTGFLQDNAASFRLLFSITFRHF